MSTKPQGLVDIIYLIGRSLHANETATSPQTPSLPALRPLRDLQFGQPLDYPTVDIKVDRDRAGQLGVTVDQVGRSLLAATSSSRFVQPNYWRDPNSGNAFQIQVQLPQNRLQETDEMGSVPVMQNGRSEPRLTDIATAAGVTVHATGEA